jgi:acetoin utilization deacetylase AcuC-like enzyme
VILFTSRRFAEHTTPPGHPESPERADVFDQVADAWRAKGVDVREPRLATREELSRVHTADYLDTIAGLAGRSAMLDPDTYTSPETEEIARLAAGAAIEAALVAWRQCEPAMALVRPPGHHAEPDKAMGFCFYNNAAVAAAALRAEGVARVAIVDIDVHHGNGTEAAFYRDPAVFYASTHQFPFYPGTGAAGVRGAGAGEGTTLNVPLPAGTKDDALLAAYEDEILPALAAFMPEVIVVSAGFDAHANDPLGGFRVTTEGYRAIVARIDEFSRGVSERRTAWITEGGYDLASLKACLDATIGVLT